MIKVKIGVLATTSTIVLVFSLLIGQTAVPYVDAAYPRDISAQDSISQEELQNILDSIGIDLQGLPVSNLGNDEGGFDSADQVFSQKLQPKQNPTEEQSSGEDIVDEEDQDEGDQDEEDQDD